MLLLRCFVDAEVKHEVVVSKVGHYWTTRYHICVLLWLGKIRIVFLTNGKWYLLLL